MYRFTYSIFLIYINYPPGSSMNRKKELEKNLLSVQKKIAEACMRGGRSTDTVQLLPVSKKKPITDIMLLRELGSFSFGENYVQELCEKFEALPEPHSWHMIGHLQKNKIRRLIGRTSLIHSVDSLSLAIAVDKEADKQMLKQDILIEVNIASEESKWGFIPDELQEAAKTIAGLKHLRIKGLMCSAPITSNPESNRQYFRLMRELLEGIQAFCPEADILSMGMSGDYMVAVEEGATMVRIGSAIFGEREG